MTDPDHPVPKGQPGPGQNSGAAAALFGLCPCCGAKTLFAGLTQFARICPACNLDYSQCNVGDGPAAFLTLIIGALVTVLAISLELSVHPPFWVHILLWVPFTSVAVIGGLRVCKAWLLGAEYRRSAGQGKLKE